MRHLLLLRCLVYDFLITINTCTYSVCRKRSAAFQDLVEARFVRNIVLIGFRKTRTPNVFEIIADGWSVKPTSNNRRRNSASLPPTRSVFHWQRTNRARRSADNRGRPRGEKRPPILSAVCYDSVQWRAGNAIRWITRRILIFPERSRARHIVSRAIWNTERQNVVWIMKVGWWYVVLFPRARKASISIHNDE